MDVTLSLIGMPGCGKSTVGVLLAKTLGLAFVDTDIEIQQQAQATLQSILDAQGYAQLRAIEEGVLLHIPLEQSVVSTGGSAVYSAPAMSRLASAGPVIYLQADLETLRQRITNMDTRGVASPPGHSLDDVYAERAPLYAQYANYTVETRGLSPSRVAQCIIDILS